MFSSKTERHSAFSEMMKKTKANPYLERVCYDDAAKTIADVARRKVEQINNPLLASLTTKNSTTMAFSSNAPRFQSKILDEETYIGPGYYEQKSCFEKGQGMRGSSKQLGGGSRKGTASTVGLLPARSM